jgi:hypothetical protein
MGNPLEACSLKLATFFCTITTESITDTRCRRRVDSDPGVSGIILNKEDYLVKWQKHNNNSKAQKQLLKKEL